MSSDTAGGSDLKADLLALTNDDVTTILEALDDSGHQRLKRLLGIQVPSRFVRGGMVNLVRSRLRRQSPSEMDMLAETFARPLLDQTHDLLGDEAFENPSLEQVRSIVGPLTARFGAGPVRVMFQLGVQNKVVASGHLAAVLADDERLARPRHPDVPPAAGDTRGAGEGAESPEVSGEEEEDEEPGEPEDERTLFTALDRLLIRTAVATHNEQLGAPTRDELTQIIEEVAGLNAARPHSMFHLGFLSALGHEIGQPSQTGTNKERRQWFAYGRLSGTARLGDLKLLAGESLADRAVTEEIVTDTYMGAALTGPIVRSLLVNHPADAAAVLDARPEPFTDMDEVLPEVLTAARVLLSQGQPTDAARLFDALVRWSPNPRVRTNLRRRLASCRRASNDFPGASNILEGIDTEPLPPEDVGLLETERALIDARVDYLGHVRFPRTADEISNLIGRLEAGEGLFASALEKNPGDERASYCLGLLAWCRDDWDAADRHLERAESAMTADELYVSTGLLPGVQFHRALALLLTLREGTDGYAFKSLSDALDAGFEPGDDQLVAAVDVLHAHGSPHTARFLAKALELIRDRTRLRRATAALAATGDPATLDLAEALAADNEGGLTASKRLDLLEGVLEGAAVARDRERLERLPDLFEVVLAQAADPALDARYLGLLTENETLRETIGGVETDLARVDLLARIGRPVEAVDIACRLFHRAAAGDLPGYDPRSLLEQLRYLGADIDTLEACQRRITRPAPDRDEVVDALQQAPLRLAFVGGDERQAQNRDAIDQQIGSRFNGSVTIDWHFPGWGANWSDAADRVEASYGRIEALVLMPFVRTNLGRRLRRTSGEHHIPWVACPGHGRQAMLTALIEAVEVAIEQRGVATS